MLAVATPVAVTHHGALVELKMGSEAWAFEAEEALALAAMLRDEGRAARRIAQLAPQIRTRGVLTDAAAPRWRQGRWEKIAERLSLRHVRVACEGREVAMYVRKARAGLPFLAAFEIAGWLRIHGKMAQAFAGVVRKV